MEVVIEIIKYAALFVILIVVSAAVLLIHNGDAEPDHDFIVSSNDVQDASGVTVHTALDFTSALNWALGHADVRVHVPKGTYHVTKALFPYNGTTLIGTGSGVDETVLFMEDSINILDVSNVTIQDLRIMGGGCIEISGRTDIGTMGNILVQDVTVIGSNNDHPGAFFSYARSNATIVGLSLIRCVADGCDGFGFGIFGNLLSITNGTTEAMRATNVWTKDVYLEDCKAINCGLNEITRHNPYVCGFDLAENTNVENVTVIRCEASNNWMNGFHWENSCYVFNVNCTNCVANDNGILNPNNQSKRVGFCFSLDVIYGEFSHVTLYDCQGHNNQGGDVWDDVTPSYDLPPAG